MSRSLAFILVALGHLAYPTVSCAQFVDDFTDGDFTTSPAWSGDASLFTVVDQAGNQLLRSNSPGAAAFFLSTPSTLASDARWEWFVDLRFATSGANYVDVYVISDAADLGSAQNGWFVRLGGTQDRVELFKRVGGTNTAMLVSPDGIINSSTSNPFRIRLERTATHDWTLSYDDGNTGSFSSIGPVTDADINTSTHFGIQIIQSSATGPINNHFFDEFEVATIPVDLSPPVLLSVTATGATNVDVRYNEPLAAGSLGTYDILPFIGVSGVELDAVDPTLVHVTPALELVNGATYSLLSEGAQDLAGNVAVAASSEFSWVVPETPGPRDVVINEIMADPSPTVGLPDAEFVELLNTTTDRTFDLAGWKLGDAASTAILPGYLLGPGQYVIITSTANAPLFTFVPERIDVGSLPTLNNDADELTLSAPDDAVIDAVSYDVSWYRDAVKQEGGWSLEQINPFAACSGAPNWIASSGPLGGTPGQSNAVFDPTPDTTPPVIVAVLVQDSVHLELVFSETMDGESLVSGTYVITPTLSILEASTSGDAPARAVLTLGVPIEAGLVHTITVEGVLDCAGNAVAQGATATFALPEPLEVGDLVINEVLYDPVDTGSDLVELYNRSAKTLSLAGLQMANITSGAVGNYRVITSDALLLLPGEYILLTPGPDDIAARYPGSHTDRFLTMALPNYVNSSGTVILADAAGAVLDRFDYDDDLHFPLVRDPEGYSLERIDPDRGTNDRTNWQTASDQAGRATPGYANSQYAPSEAVDEMTIAPAIFSPDNDGHQDVLTVAYRFAQDGYVGTMTVFDIAGREVRRLLDNQLLGTSGAVSWDGITEDGSKGRMGPHIVHFEVFDLEGNVRSYRKTVTLAHRLDQ